MRQVSFKIDQDLLEKLDAYCIRNKKERSEVIREAIILYLQLNDHEDVPTAKIEKPFSFYKMRPR